MCVCAHATGIFGFQIIFIDFLYVTSFHQPVDGSKIANDIYTTWYIWKCHSSILTCFYYFCETLVPSTFPPTPHVFVVLVVLPMFLCKDTLLATATFLSSVGCTSLAPVVMFSKVLWLFLIQITRKNVQITWRKRKLRCPLLSYIISISSQFIPLQYMCTSRLQRSENID